MKNKLTFARPAYSTTHTVGKLQLCTVPSTDEDGREFDKLIAVEKNGDLSWVCKSFTA